MNFSVGMLTGASAQLATLWRFSWARPGLLESVRYSQVGSGWIRLDQVGQKDPKRNSLRCRFPIFHSLHRFHRRVQRLSSLTLSGVVAKTGTN